MVGSSDTTGAMLLRPARTLLRPAAGFFVVDARRLSSTTLASCVGLLLDLDGGGAAVCGSCTLRRSGFRVVLAGAGVNSSSSSKSSIFTSTLLFSSSEESTIILRCAARRGRAGEVCAIVTEICSGRFV